MKKRSTRNPHLSCGCMGDLPAWPEAEMADAPAQDDPALFDYGEYDDPETGAADVDEEAAMDEILDRRVNAYSTWTLPAHRLDL